MGKNLRIAPEQRLLDVLPDPLGAPSSRAPTPGAPFTLTIRCVRTQSHKHSGRGCRQGWPWASASCELHGVYSSQSPGTGCVFGVDPQSLSRETAQRPGSWDGRDRIPSGAPRPAPWGGPSCAGGPREGQGSLVWLEASGRRTRASVVCVAVEPVFYARPDGPAIQLQAAPRLASWNRADDPDQVRLTAALDDAEALLAGTVAALSGPVALRLDVGLAAQVPLLEAHDLDNYAFPLANRLTQGRGLPVVTVWATKAIAPRSFVRCEAAAPGPPRGAGSDFRATVRTTSSSESAAYKQQISDQLTDASELPEGPVSLELAFVVGPRRNWLNLWKPTIDALDRIVGRTRPDRKWHPSDGRITELGLHCALDKDLGDAVVVAIAARSTRGGGPWGGHRNGRAWGR